MAGRDLITNLQISLMQISMVMLSLEDFSAQLIRHALNGGAMDDEALAGIKASCVRNLKNSDAPGVPIEHETEAFRKAVDTLKQLIDSAIIKGRQRV